MDVENVELKGYLGSHGCQKQRSIFREQNWCDLGENHTKILPLDSVTRPSYLIALMNGHITSSGPRFYAVPENRQAILFHSACSN
jgi:hypothetical protein